MVDVFEVDVISGRCVVEIDVICGKCVFEVDVIYRGCILFWKYTRFVVDLFLR